MKRDMNLVKSILEIIQTRLPSNTAAIHRWLGVESDTEKDRVRFHLRLMTEAGFISQKKLELTWQGYDLLETLSQQRNPEAEAAALETNLRLKK